MHPSTLAARSPHVQYAENFLTLITSRLTLKKFSVNPYWLNSKRIIRFGAVHQIHDRINSDAHEERWNTVLFADRFDSVHGVTICNMDGAVQFGISGQISA
jgi:hypothetical protein